MRGQRLMPLIALLMPLCAAASGMTDSIFVLPATEVRANTLFSKEDAGMQQTLIDSLVLRNKLNQSLSDLLSENTPVFIKSHGRGALATASFRGTAPSHTTVSWNGIPVNSPMAGMVDFSLIPVYIIDDIQLKHGTASVAERSGGLGGSIGISNRADWNEGFSAEYIQGTGSFSTFDHYLRATVGTGKWQYRARGYRNISENDYPFINKSIGHVENGQMIHPVDTNKHAAYSRSGTLQELYVRPGTTHLISAKYWGQWAERSIPQVTSYEGPDDANRNRQEDTDHRIVADWSHYMDHGRLLVRSGFAQKEINYALKNQVSGAGFIPAIYSESKTQSHVNHVSYTYETNGRFSMDAALDINHHRVSTADTVNNTGYEKQRTEQSAMLAAHYTFAGKINVKALLRQDRVDGRFAPFVPFLGADIRLSDEHPLILKANVARNYHQPTLNDLYWQPGGNPDLLPEMGFSVEAGLHHQKEINHTMVNTGITAYRSDIDNWIIWIPSFKGYWEPRNIKKVLSKGLEIDAAIKSRLGPVSVRGNGSYAYTRALNHGDPLVWGDESRGKQLVYIPLHSGNFMVHLAYRNVGFTWQHNTYSERFTTTSNDVSRRNRLYPYFMNNITLSGDFAFRRLELTAKLKVFNLFDESYRSELYRPMPGRNYLVTLKAGI